jgi:hypothetical protein
MMIGDREKPTEESLESEETMLQCLEFHFHHVLRNENGPQFTASGREPQQGFRDNHVLCFHIQPRASIN